MRGRTWKTRDFWEKEKLGLKEETWERDLENEGVVTGRKDLLEEVTGKKVGYAHPKL